MDSSIDVLITTYKVHPYYSATISVVKCIATRCGSCIGFVVALLLTFLGSVGHGWRRHSVALLTVHFYFSVLLKNLMHKLWTGALQAMCHRSSCYVQVDRGFINGCDAWTTQSERCLYKPVVLVFLPIRKSPDVFKDVWLFSWNAVFM